MPGGTLAAGGVVPATVSAVTKANSSVYTENVLKFLILCGVALAVSTPALRQQTTNAAGPSQTLEPGVLSPHQTCSAHPDQTYALYLPSHYTPHQRWPVIYAFDPAARGNLPLELMKDAAERYGYVVVGSNNSRNGSWKVEAEAAQAMIEDTRSRLSIDDRRIYFAGFSGGARVASEIAERCKCAAGVLLNGAGFSLGAEPSRSAVFAVFAAVGDFDFNYPEVTRLDQKLEESGFPHRLRHFDGPHQWAPAEVMDEALAWLRLVAMKENRDPKDEAFVAVERAHAVTRAQAFHQSGDLYAAWREYRQAAATFDGLTEINEFRQGAASLASQKAVRDGSKREQLEFDEQDQLTAQISSGLAALRQISTTLADTLSQTEHQIIALRERAAHEKRPDQARVLRRAMAGILVEAMESGSERLEAKDVTLAKDYFLLATRADPDSTWALSRLAAARALGGDRKGTLEALRQAKEKNKDSAAFTAWLQGEPAFAKLRTDPQFRALLGSP
jgi:predicted esterase